MGGGDRVDVTGVSVLRNLGPKSQQMLAQAGITSVQQLHKLGVVAAYLQVKRSGPMPVSIFCGRSKLG